MSIAATLDDWMPMLTDHDHAMIRHAIARGDVVVRHGDRVRLAKLMSWRPRHNGKHQNKARVQYPSGTFAHVPLTAITIPAREEQHAR
jgi:hypothetical protein